MENRKDSHKNIKNPPLAPPPLQPLEPAPPQLHEQEQSQPQQQPPVQRLTGKPSTSTASSLSSQSISAPEDTLAASDGGSISPRPTYAPMEKADDLNEVGFLGGVETTDQDYPPGILSPGRPTYAPMEKADDLNEVGFLGGVETTDQDYPPGILSPGRPTYAPMEKADDLNEVGLLGGVETTDQDYPPGILSPGRPTYAPMEKADDLNEVGFLGGVETTDQSYPPGILSPRPTYAPMEKADDLNEVGFLGGVETTDQYYQRHHHHNRAMESPSFYPPGILSPRPTSLPPRSLEFFSTVGPTHPQGHDEDRAIHHSVNDTGTIGSAYDRYLQNVQTSSEEIGMVRRGGDSVMPSPSMGGRGGVLPPDDRALGSGQQDLVGRPRRELLPLPPDASNTLYVEGLPSNCSRREVAHIFRPFVGYREVRLVTKDSKQRNGDPVVLCFVDFKDPACAATARTALQGYRMDEDEPDSKRLHIHFSSRRPGQSGGRR